MKRFLILLLIFSLTLCGCKKQTATDISGLETTPEGVDWRVWDTYTPVTLTMGQESVDVLMGLDAIHLVIYYDREVQEELGKITILEPLSDVQYSMEHLRILDQNQDGYDDICIPDMLTSGDRVMNWWLWDPDGNRYQYSTEYSQTQEEIGGDISWQLDKDFAFGMMDTPDGPQDLLILVEEQQITIYLDTREETVFGTAQIPDPLSPEAKANLAFYTYWECRDLDGDGWGDLQLPYRWVEAEDGTVCQYNYCWLWDPQTGTYSLDPVTSSQPAI